MPTPQNPRTLLPGLDQVDLAILRELVTDGRITNAALATRVGVAESTCIQRVRALRASDAITGFRAQLNLAHLGLPIQAVIKVRLRSHNRVHVTSFHAAISQVAGILTAFHVAGADDYLIHVAVGSPGELRDFLLEQITVHPAVRHAETHLVFEVITGRGVLTEVAGSRPT